MKNGRLYDGETLDEAYSRARQLPRESWCQSASDFGASHPAGDDVLATP
jgi:hypothetical protein